MSPEAPIKPIRLMKARKQLALLAIMAAVWVIATGFAAAQEPKPANPDWRSAGQRGEGA